MTEINVPNDLKDRVTAGWETSTSARDVDDSEFWSTVADADERMAKLWQEVRRTVHPDAESVLGKLLLDAESYRHSEARRAREYMQREVRRRVEH